MPSWGDGDGGTSVATSGEGDGDGSGEGEGLSGGTEAIGSSYCTTTTFPKLLLVQVTAPLAAAEVDTPAVLASRVLGAESTASSLTQAVPRDALKVLVTGRTIVAWQTVSLQIGPDALLPILKAKTPVRIRVKHAAPGLAMCTYSCKMCRSIVCPTRTTKAYWQHLFCLCQLWLAAADQSDGCWSCAITNEQLQISLQANQQWC